MKLSPTAQKFILHWGEMGTRWGINRTVAQVHALLYLSAKPLHAEDIATTLGVARSNVSTSLRELQGWGIVRVVHVLGDRRDHFESLTDAWALLNTIIEQRKRREIDPTVALLAECLAEADKAGASEAHLRERLGSLHELFTTATAWYDEIARLPTAAVFQVLRLGGKVRKLLGLANRT